MGASWRDEISDPTERKIFEALDNPAWDFRTVEGISRETALPESLVLDTIAKYPNLIRRTPVPDTKGRGLYTLTSRGGGLREWYSTTRAFVTKST